MKLRPIDCGPEPSDDDLKPYFKSGQGEVERMLAAMEWRLDVSRENPDVFLVPFATDAPVHRLGFPSYDDYLASPLWKKIKVFVLKRAGGKCAACGRPTKTVHHRDYRLRVLRGKDLSALIALCSACHNKVHNPGGNTPAAARPTWQDQEAELARLIAESRPTQDRGAPPAAAPCSGLNPPDSRG